MTDKEIKKALECHCHPVCCVDCPMHNREHDNCVTELWSLSLDLINRLEAEAEKYYNAAKIQQDVSMKRFFEIKRLKEKLAEKQAEIENYSHNTRSLTEAATEMQAALKKQSAEIEAYKHYYKECFKDLKNAHAEVERLKKLLAEEETKYTKCAKRFYKEGVKEFAERVKRYIDVGHLRSPTEICFSELAVVNMIDYLVKEMVGDAE